MTKIKELMSQSWMKGNCWHTVTRTQFFLFSCQLFVAEKNINKVGEVLYILNLAFLHLATWIYYVLMLYLSLLVCFFLVTASSVVVFNIDTDFICVVVPLGAYQWCKLLKVNILYYLNGKLPPSTEQHFLRICVNTMCGSKTISPLNNLLVAKKNVLNGKCVFFIFRATRQRT
jgi:hypothetical protein